MKIRARNIGGFAEFISTGKEYEISKDHLGKISSGTHIGKFEKEKIVAIKNPEYKMVEMSKINDIFDSKVSDYLKKYPSFEIATFETKRNEALRFQETGKSEYLEILLTEKNKVRKKYGKDEFTMKDFAGMILAHGNSYATAFAQLEAWKDSEEFRIESSYILPTEETEKGK